ncbi:MAG TPA: polysaccharide deacetylase family protein [Polyangia bacterium]|jgi:chitin deacetylase|nr:polysaccharide deacetylase family protein [Polyangia bacterium]
MVRVALTFDDGPGPATRALLDVLAAHDVRVTFFCLGRNLERLRDVAVDAARAGHLLGNHTYSHARPDAIGAAELTRELARTDELLRDVYAAAGVAAPAAIPVRLPYGVVGDDARLPMLAALGRAHTSWTADFADWLDPDPTTLCARMQAHIAAQAAGRRDAVLDLHDASRLLADRSATVAAVAQLLADGAAPSRTFFIAR